MVEVTKTDRDATSAYWQSCGIGTDKTRAFYSEGKADDSQIIQAFARHRIAERKAIVDWLRETWPPDRYGEDWPVTSAINAIEAGERRKGQAHD